MTAEVVPPEIAGAIGRSLMAEGPDGVIILGPDQDIRRFNRAAERIFGYREAEMLGARLDALLPRRRPASTLATWMIWPGRRRRWSGWGSGGCPRPPSASRHYRWTT